MTEKQYQILSDLFHEFNDEFWRLSPKTLDAFFTRLYQGR